MEELQALPLKIRNRNQNSHFQTNAHTLPFSMYIRQHCASKRKNQQDRKDIRVQTFRFKRLSSSISGFGQARAKLPRPK